MHEHPNCAQKTSPQQHSSYTLHPHQVQAIDMTVESLRRGRKRPMLQGPCGMGKTIIASEIFNRALAKGKRAIFTVPSISLIDQTHSKFFRSGIYDIGIIQANHPLTNPDAPIQIASVQTLLRRKVPPADLVMIDEAHLRWKFYSKWMADPDWAKVPFIGLSGTPWSKGLARDYDDLLVAATSKSLMDQGFLSQYRIFAPMSLGARPDLEDIPTVNTRHGLDFEEAMLSERMQKPQLVADCVQTWLEKGENLPTLVFCVNKAHAQVVEERYKEAGVTVAYVDEATKRQEREVIGRKFHSGEVKLVVSIGTMIVGVDWDVRCVQWLRPTKSEIIWCQGNARAFRLAESKTDALILDHSDNATRLGFPTDIHHEFLDDGTPLTAEAKKRVKEEREERLPQECMFCGFLKPKGVRKCPCCGKGIVCDVETAPGELFELRPNPSKAPADKQTWYSQFLWVESQRGYKDGWAAQQLKAKFGDYPRGLSSIQMPACQEVLNFVKARMIRWARSKYNPQRAA